MKIEEYTVKQVETRPERYEDFEHGVIFIYKQWLWFLCPCGCGGMRRISTSPKDNPHWNFDREKVTISPSINHMNGCRSHYFITNGKVRMC